jgi:hypothetical protein
MSDTSGSRLWGGLVLTGLGFVFTMMGLGFVATGEIVGVLVILVGGGLLLPAIYLTVLGAAQLDE